METISFEDGIGRRRRATDSNGSEVETLLLCRELAEAEGSEAALVGRAGQLAGFSHAAFAPVLRVERPGGATGGLAIVSSAVNGTRLSEILRSAQQKSLAPDLDAARFVLGQVAVAVADFHRHSRDVSHGAIGPERIVMCPDGRAVIVETILAPVLQRLQMARTRLWTEFRVPVPPVAGTARFDQMTDVIQLGVLALALVLGRPIGRDEYPNRLRDLLMEVSSPNEAAERQPVSRALIWWIHRTLQMEPRSSFRTAAEAATALEAVLAEEPRHKVSAAAAVKYRAACASEADGGRKLPAVLTAPPTVGSVWASATADAASTRALSRPEPAASGNSQEAAASPPVRVPHVPAGSSLQQRMPLAGGRARVSPGRTRRFDWAAVRKVARVSMLSLGLVALLGATYLGARGYFSLAGLTGGRGTLVVESLPTGVEVFVDGLPRGRTPTTLELPAGEHTLVLRTSRGITLVPVVVVAGTSRVERIDIRKRPVTPRQRPPTVPPPQSNPPGPQ